MELHAEERGLNLNDCYQLSLKRSEQIAISETEIEIARHRYFQALGTVLPKASFIYRNDLQDPVSTNSESGFSGNFSQISRSQTAFNLYQPLFQGFREFQSIKLSKVDQVRQQLLLENAKRLLYEDVTVAYLTIARIERDIDATRMILGVARRQLQDLRKEVSLGKSRESDASEQATIITLLEAQLENRRGERKVAYETLSFLTGLNPHPPISKEAQVKPQAETLEQYVALGRKRADIQAAKKETELRKGEIAITRSELLPNAGISANIYPYREGFLNSSRWDAVLQLEVPIFNGESWGRLRESKAQSKISEYETQEKERLAVREIRSAFQSFRSSEKELKKYQSAAAQARKTYQLQKGDFSLGLIDNQSLLVSQRTWLEAIRSRDTAEALYWLRWVQLQTRTGLLP
ncbi:MAG: TolC family protein [Deltaproteobacteria bacterium]|nr:TolC family protein [Deltaproteobacteria bacterium]